MKVRGGEACQGLWKAESGSRIRSVSLAPGHFQGPRVFWSSQSPGRQPGAGVSGRSQGYYITGGVGGGKGKGGKSEGKEGRKQGERQEEPMRKGSGDAGRKSSSSPWGSPARKGVLWPGWVSQAGSALLPSLGSSRSGPPTLSLPHSGGVQRWVRPGRWPLPPLSLSILGFSSSFLSLLPDPHGLLHSVFPLLPSLPCSALQLLCLHRGPWAACGPS